MTPRPPVTPAPPMVPRRAPLPPGARSRSAHLLIGPAGRGEFALPCCAACGRFAWPVPEACPACLSPDLPLVAAPRGGQVIAATTAEAPADPYFRARAPWRVGLVQMDCGPQALVHLHPGCGPGDRLRLSLLLDRAGQAVLHGGPEGETDMSTDPQWQAMTCDPGNRRVLITDARHIAALPLARALLAAGAAQVWLGLDGDSPPFDHAAAEAAGARVVPLDLRSDRSVRAMAADIGDRVGIVVNTADLPHPDAAPEAEAVRQAREAMEVTAFGLMRLMRSLAPIMAGRGADGAVPAVAWVNLMPVMARVAYPGFGGYGAAHAAALVLAPALRALLAPGGVRLMTAWIGPTDTGPFRDVPPPRLSGAAIAGAVVAALQAGQEEAIIGELARDWLERHARNPRALERDLAQGRL